jgi:immunoglobulin-binding protein 1
MDMNNKLVQNLLPMNGMIPNNAKLVDDIINQRLHVRENVFKPTNLPTMTLDEFADKEIVKMAEMERQQEEAKRNAPSEDSDDEKVADEKTYKAREWDDWKDAHEKGAGNKMGRK